MPKLDRWASSPVAWAPDHTSFVERETRSLGSWDLRDQQQNKLGGSALFPSATANTAANEDNRYTLIYHV